LYNKETTYAAPVATVVGHWGYKSLNGAALGTVAALKKYGLLDYEGSGDRRKAKLSQLAEVILVHPDEDSRRLAIREAALLPPVHRELWEKYGDQLPSDSTLKWELTHDRGFTQTGAAEFIPVYRATIAYARLASDEPRLVASAVRDDDLDAPEDDDGPHASDGPRHASGSNPVLTSSLIRTYSVPLVSGGVIQVSGEFPITESDWEQFMAVLAAMRPGLVSVEAGSASDE